MSLSMYVSATAFAILAAASRSEDSKLTLINWLIRTGSTLSRERKRPTTTDSSASADHALSSTGLTLPMPSWRIAVCNHVSC